MRENKPSQSAVFEKRKADHLRLALAPNNQTTELSGFDQIQLTHEALPDLNFNDIDISTESLGNRHATPFFVSSMTAGHQAGIQLNQTLAQACQNMGWAMGVGSQRRQLFDPSSDDEWKSIRRIAPDVIFYGNLGISQLITTPRSHIQRLVDSLQAAAMIIHLNPLQECLQPEGTPQFKGAEKALATLCANLSVPIIVKETGCGFSLDTLKRLANYPIAAVDVSGLGGTHWGRIEGQRTAAETGSKPLADCFQNWGITTLQSLRAAATIELPYEIWGSGGVRNGVDAAKLLALGARRIGIAKPMLSAALAGVDQTIATMQDLQEALKISLFCTGCANLSALGEDKLCL